MTKRQALTLVDMARCAVSCIDEDEIETISIATETLATDGHAPAGFRGIVLDVRTASGGSVLTRFPLALADKNALRPALHQPRK